jgi:raffinose/stachyose/melibiose transport system substrate-binding protein
VKHRRPLRFIGAIVLGSVLLASVVQVLRLSYATSERSGKAIVRVAHTHLGDGYREALDVIIAEYNRLPHVQAAGYEVKQMAIPGRVYQQFINIHLLSGTAPDIAEKSKGVLTSDLMTGQFFEPIERWVNEPNPYNSAEYLPPNLDPEVVRQLSGPWRDTFIDGLDKGWSRTLSNHYSVPFVSVGGNRIFYNRTLMTRAKALVREALAATPPPEWLRAELITRPEEADTGWVRDTPALRAWAATDAPPDTLGRLFLVCAAIREIGRRDRDDKLVPFAGSVPSSRLFATVYQVPFLAALSQEVDVDQDSEVSPMETYAAWAGGKWSFSDPRVRAFHECVRAFCRQFPSGWAGLDRDQASRRFIQGASAMIATGGYDFPTLVNGVRARPHPGDRFEVGIIDFPLPGPDERWTGLATMPRNERSSAMESPKGVYKQSKYKEEAIDFLRYLTSYSVNPRFADGAGRLPAVFGATTDPAKAALRPKPEGVADALALNFNDLGRGRGEFIYADPLGELGTVHRRALWLYASGDITYAQMVERIELALRDPRRGLERLWFETAREDAEQVRNQERLLSAIEAEELFLGEATAARRYRAALATSAAAWNGRKTRFRWSEIHPGKPFPER